MDKGRLISAIRSLTDDKNMVQIRMEQVRNELLQLMEEERRFEETLGLEQSKLDALEGSLSEEAHQVISQLNVDSNNVKVEECVAGVAREMCEFAKVTNSVSSAVSVAATV